MRFLKSIMEYYFQERVIYEYVRQIPVSQMVLELLIFYLKNLFQILTHAYTRQSSIYYRERIISLKLFDLGRYTLHFHK